MLSTFFKMLAQWPTAWFYPGTANIAAFGIFSESLIAGLTKRKVWLRIVHVAQRLGDFLGMWQAMQSLPVLSAW